MDPVLSHLIAFVAGTGVGASGQYFGAKYTDQRRKQERRAESRARFRKAEAEIPKLIEEMRTDLHVPGHSLFRDFWVLPVRGVSLGSPGEIIAYFESEHPNLQHAVALLENLGYVSRADLFAPTAGAAKFRMTEEFAELLLKSK